MAAGGWVAKQRLLNRTTQVLGASVTQAVSDVFPISPPGALALVVAVDISAITSTVELELQTNLGTEDSNWVTAKSVAVSATGRAYIRMLSEAPGDQAQLPLLTNGRIRAVCGGGDAITITSIQVLQAE